MEQSGISGIYCSQLKPECCACCGGEKPRLHRCSVCKISRYCSVDCQRKHWKVKHKKGECEQFKKTRELWLQQSESENATGIYIIATRLALGQGNSPRDVKLAIELYKKAAELDVPIAGGHPTAMVHLGIHYERGIGVEQDFAEALRWYNRVLQHPGQAGEENMHAALSALSRFYAEGFGVEASEEMAQKYAEFAQSNPENLEELTGLENWWADVGKEAWISTRK